jgi:hypothetical protein
MDGKEGGGVRDGERPPCPKPRGETASEELEAPPGPACCEEALVAVV